MNVRFGLLLLATVGFLVLVPGVATANCHPMCHLPGAPGLPTIVAWAAVGLAATVVVGLTVRSFLLRYKE